jgi:imidazolonepropionase-like amidohydrolase
MRTTAWPAAARDNARLFFHSTVVLPDGTLQDGAVLCTEGRISAVGPLALLSVPDNATLFDARDGYVVPRFVDIHSHGGGGADFMDAPPGGHYCAAGAGSWPCSGFASAAASSTGVLLIFLRLVVRPARLRSRDALRTSARHRPVCK